MARRFSCKVVATFQNLIRIELRTVKCDQISERTWGFREVYDRFSRFDCFEVIFKISEFDVGSMMDDVLNDILNVGHWILDFKSLDLVIN